MPFIVNVPMTSIVRGQHRHSDNCVLISITDIGYEDVIPALCFKHIYRFSFMDVLKDSEQVADGISQEQAKSIVEILKESLANGSDVVVHCHAGLCRSGAVAEVGAMLGFTGTGAVRQPNSFVKWRLMKELGWTYD